MSYMDPDTLTLATFIFHLARPAMMALANKLEEKDEKNGPRLGGYIKQEKNEQRLQGHQFSP